ncbi:MAG: type transport system ATP-binding protein [Thermoplasmata archaeon]|jgi:ABC-2 type transport system ATP-binding protein|nr:type transport system ATP-binding protein [Thermoplasmata archaeon]
MSISIQQLESKALCRRRVAEPVIQVRDLRKTYPDGTEAVKGITFNVRRGEIFGFLGPNGAGKTSTMRILGTLQEATGGDAKVLGLDVRHDAGAVKQRIGFAMQEVGMDDLATAREMLALHGKLYGMSGREAKAKGETLLQTFDLVEHGDRRVTRFSGGMQRRLDLAVTLIHEPEVLFLDEPSTGLDPKSRSTLWAVLRKLRDERGMTIMLSTHYMDEADALCDRIAIVNKGVIAAIDTPTNLKRAVGSDTVRVTLANGIAPPAWASLQRVFGPQNITHKGEHLDIRVKDGARALVPALRLVTEQGVAIRETKVVTPTLEDAFLKFTGARFDEAATKPEVAA